jgi:hypothetical protein
MFSLFFWTSKKPPTTKPPPVADPYEVIAKCLTDAIHRKGYARVVDTKDLPYSQAWRYQLVNKLIDEQGRFVRQYGERGSFDIYFPTEPEGASEPQQEVIKADPGTLSASELPPDVAAFFDGKQKDHMERPFVRMTTFELSRLGEKPVPSEMQETVDKPLVDPDYEYSWTNVAKSVPVEIVDVAKKTYDHLISIGNRVTGAANEVLKRTVPKFYADKAFERLCAKYPLAARNRAWFDKMVFEEGSPERVLEIVDEVMASERLFLQSPDAPIIRDRNGREQVDVHASWLAEKADLDALYRGPMSRRTVVWPKNEGPSFEHAVSEINRHGGGAWLDSVR